MKKLYFIIEVTPEYNETPEELIEYFTESIGDHIPYKIEHMKVAVEFDLGEG